MILLGILCAAISSASLLFLLVGVIHREGYEQGKESGYMKGYSDGRADEQNWWIRAEEEIREVKR